MFKILAFLTAILISKENFCQTFLNGDFESNNAAVDRLNLANSQYNNFMLNSTAFGTLGNMDIITSNSYCGSAQHGRWYVALTGGGTDAISLKLSTPLIAGETYGISFYDRLCIPISVVPNPVQIGLSDTDDNFGTVIYSASEPIYEWTLRSFSFIAPNNGQYVTVSVKEGDSFNTWCQVDNFSFFCPLLADLGNDTTLCEGENLALDASALNATYLWQDGSVSANYIVSSPGIYRVTVSTRVCSVSDTINVNFKKCPGFLYIPNAFTPNGDGKNDLFKVPGDLNELRMEIYNRWGELLFRTVTGSDGWDGTFKGTDQPIGTYIYFVRYKDQQNILKELKGTITLLR